MLFTGFGLEVTDNRRSGGVVFVEYTNTERDVLVRIEPNQDWSIESICYRLGTIGVPIGNEAVPYAKRLIGLAARHDWTTTHTRGIPAW